MGGTATVLPVPRDKSMAWRMAMSRREPFPPLAYLRPIAILQAIDLSLGTGSTVAVPPIPDF